MEDYKKIQPEKENTKKKTFNNNNNNTNKDDDDKKMEEHVPTLKIISMHEYKKLKTTFKKVKKDKLPYLPTPSLELDMIQGQFLSGV